MVCRAAAWPCFVEGLVQALASVILTIWVIHFRPELISSPVFSTRAFNNDLDVPALLSGSYGPACVLRWTVYLFPFHITPMSTIVGEGRSRSIAMRLLLSSCASMLDSPPRGIEATADYHCFRELDSSPKPCCGSSTLAPIGPELLPYAVVGCVRPASPPTSHAA